MHSCLAFRTLQSLRSAHVISLLLALGACGIFLSDKSMIQQKKDDMMVSVK
jgi:hypothetical protein